jgi:hypothetical protein
VGTLAPALRASANPIATACLGFVTLLPDFPDFSFPAFILLIADSTLADAFGLYLRVLLFVLVDLVWVGIAAPSGDLAERWTRPHRIYLHASYPTLVSS